MLVPYPVFVLYQVAQSQPTASPWIGPALGAAFVSSIVAAALGFFNLRASRVSLERSSAFALATQMVELRTKQLTELYGPLIALNRTSKVVYERLQVLLPSEIDRDTFRLLDHLPNLAEEPVAGPLVKRLIEIGKKTSDVLTEKGGLAYEKEWPKSFHEFIAHYYLLVAAMEGSNPSVGKVGAQEGYYPRAFHDDLVRAYQKIQDEINALDEVGLAEVAKLKGKKPRKVNGSTSAQG